MSTQSPLHRVSSKSERTRISHTSPGRIDQRTQRRAKRWTNFAIASLAAAGSMSVVQSAYSATITWSSPTSGAFETGSNWAGGVAPLSTSDTAVFRNNTMLNGVVSFSQDVTNTAIQFKNTGGGIIEFSLGNFKYTTTVDNTVGQAAGENAGLKLSSGTMQSRILFASNVAFTAGSTQGHIYIEGPTSKYIALQGARIGALGGGSNSTLLVSNGGELDSSLGAFHVGLQGASNCVATVTGTDSLLSALSIQLGGANASVASTGATLEVLAGGEVISNSTMLTGVGSTFSSSDTLVKISGTNSKLSTATFGGTTGFGVEIGRNWGNNQLLIENGGSMTMTTGDLALGREAGSTNNFMRITDGTLTLNGAGGLTQDLADLGTGRVDVRRGTFKFESGTATMPGLLANTGATSVLQFEGGTAIVKNALIANGSPLLIGDATGATFTYRLNDNAGSHTFTDGLTIQSDGVVEKSATIFGNVTNNGQMNFGAGSGSMRIVGSLTNAVGAKVDVADNALIVTGTSVGSWDGSNYTGVTGDVALGRNGGVWNGNGITTSMSDATSGSNYTMLGVASGAEVLGLGPTDTATWTGKTVTGTDALVMYTYGGDANLSGFVDIDDYGQIDFNASTGGVLTGWFNGDFDYNGIQDIDDYGIIDFVINIQGSPFPVAGGMSLAAVPEPASLSILALGAAASLRRRRRQ